VNKSLTTLNLPAPPKADNSKQAQWDELRSVFPIYVALAKQLQLDIPIPQNKRILPEKIDPELSVQIQCWLDAMDQQVMVHQLRHLLQMTTLNASESGLRALIMRHLRKPSKTSVDRDKADFLLVQYFALTAPPKIYHKQIELADVANVLKPVFGEVDSTPLPWCEPLEKMIVSLRGFKSLRDLLKTNFIEQGRRVKESAGGMFYDPSAMLAFIRFNFLLRRTLIELMHADLIFIRSGLTQLQNAGTRTIDCQTVGLGKAESAIVQTKIVAALLEESNAVATYWGTSLNSRDTFLAESAKIAPDWEDGVWLVRFTVDGTDAGGGQFWLAKDPKTFDFVTALKKRSVN